MVRADSLWKLPSFKFSLKTLLLSLFPCFGEVVPGLLLFFVLCRSLFIVVLVLALLITELVIIVSLYRMNVISALFQEEVGNNLKDALREEANYKVGNILVIRLSLDVINLIHERFNLIMLDMLRSFVKEMSSNLLIELLLVGPHCLCQLLVVLFNLLNKLCNN